jgi:large subunit ribosomal protein L3
MVNTLFATKHSMAQAWTTSGKRVAVTRCKVSSNIVVNEQPLVNPAMADTDQAVHVFEVGYGSKKIKAMSKPLRSKLEKSGFSKGVLGLTGVRVTATADQELPKAGDVFKVEDIFVVGDVVKVQGITKGRGFAGAMKRHGFKGGPKTHGQSDRARAVGSIGAGTTPGHVLKGKRMPGHYGVETQTVKGLVIVHIDPTNQELWLSGPVPGHMQAVIRIDKTGTTKNVELNKAASGIAEAATPEVSQETQEA